MLAGKEIGPYIVGKKLGAGAMGTVYLGRNARTGEKVAVKELAEVLTDNDMALSRFKREISILKQLDHPNIVKRFKSGTVNQVPFIIMEFVDGESLDRVMERRDRMTWEELVPMGQQLCSALQYAHDKGIIHRDLKPSNLMLTKDGTVKLTDFGIAKDMDVTALTQANSTVGTAAYMSPEQCKGVRDITHKSDLYSMGVMFYELLTGRKPFVADSVMEMFKKHLDEDFVRPSRIVFDIPIWLDTLICQLLEKDPEKRPFNAAMVAESLAMVREKVEAQQSAGVVAAKRRRVDRTTVDGGLDETDLDAARTLLGKKKKKPKVVPFYRKGWFTLCGVAVLLVGLSYVFYLAFLKVPSADSYMQRAQTLLKSTGFSERKEGRETLDEFFKYYPDHPQAAAMKALADNYDLDETERQMLNRRDRFKADGEAEELARAALDEEDFGKLKEAAKSWQQLAKFEAKKGEDHSWGLVAKKYLKDVEVVPGLYKFLQRRVALDKENAKKYTPQSKAEGLALDALRNESLNDWSDLKSKMKNDPDNRRWYLLATWQYRELSDKQKQRVD